MTEHIHWRRDNTAGTMANAIILASARLPVVPAVVGRVSVDQMEPAPVRGERTHDRQVVPGDDLPSVQQHAGDGSHGLVGLHSMAHRVTDQDTNDICLTRDVLILTSCQDTS